MINYTKIVIECPTIKYIEYKTKRDIARSKHKLSEEFLSRILINPDWQDELGKFVYIHYIFSLVMNKNGGETAGKIL